VAQPTPLFADDGTLTVGEIGRRIERALRREFGDKAVWVRGEIRDLNRAQSGHVHFNLTGDDRALPVVLFASDRERVNRLLKTNGPSVRMDDGIEVRIRVEVRWFSPKSQVSLRMLAIDPTFTLGRLAEDRELLLRRLSADGLLAAQQRLRLPAVPLRVGLVTSLGSAAHADVVRTLESGGFGFRIVECDTRVQGPNAQPSIIAALRAVRRAGVDVICLVRGGGARTDLAAFDGEELARTVAGLDVPVLTGIGHETDTSVADEVAWQRHVTPTACAAFLIEHVRRFCSRRDDVLKRCLRAASSATARAGDHLERDAGRLSGAARRHLRDANRGLDAAAAALARRPGAVLDTAEATVGHRAAMVAAHDPARLLARGWSITHRSDGRLVKSPVDVEQGDELQTRTAGGSVVSTVTACDADTTATGAVRGAATDDRA
jgi:exodeoxyribonuclease VII large subunit